MSDKKVADAVNTYVDNTIKPGMLSSPHIAYCVSKYGIIENYEKSCLGPATYNMRIGGKVLTWDKGKKVEFTLGEQEDKNRDICTKLELKPNSLTFITTIEKFNLPKDIIARFNLKSKWVHEGLLLGTGPIVDPELKANLLIPLHNFSSQSVWLNFKDEIISVEFTKTLNPDDQLNLEGSDLKYVANKSRIFDFEGYRRRIGGKKVESSVSSAFGKYDKTIGRFKRYSWLSGIGIVAAYVGLITLVITTYMFISSARNEVVDANKTLSEYKAKLDDSKSISLNSEYIDLKNQVQKLKRDLELLKSRDWQKINLEKTSGKYEEKIQTMEKQIKKLEEKLNKVDSKVDVK
jgi:deoxycytidine triphosphate deaminase